MRPNTRPAQDDPAARRQLQSALLLLQRGDTGAAITSLSALALHPLLRADANAALAQAWLNRGDTGQALQCAQAAARYGPDSLPVALTLARCLRAAGRASEAVVACQAARQHLPTQVDLLSALALAQRDAGQLDEATATWHQAIAMAPGQAGLHHNLGNLLQQRGQTDGARVAYLQAVKLAPQHVPSYLELASMARQQGDLAAAAWCVAQAVHLAPAQPRVRSLQAELAMQSQQWPQATEAWQLVLQALPGDATAWVGLARSLLAQGALQQGLAAATEAVKRAPQAPAGHYWCAQAFHQLGRVAEACEAAAQALACQPQGQMRAECTFLHTVSLLAMGEVSRAEQGAQELKACASDAGQQAMALSVEAAVAAGGGDMSRSLAAGRAALALAPGLQAAAVAVCTAPLYLGADDVVALKRDADQAWAALRTRQDGVYLPNSPEPGRRLRVGYLSGDLRKHSCAHFIEPLWAAHDASQVEIFAYATHGQEDAVTTRLRALVPHWRTVPHLSAADLRKQIRADGIDILIDLSGLTESGRPDVLSLRCAPLQLSWLGYLGSMPMGTVDARLSDATVNPARLDEGHREHIHRMPRLYLSYQPDANAPVPAPMPAAQGQPLTLGSFNAIQKLSPACIALWSRLLQRVPHARLMLKTRGLADAGVRQRVQDAFAAQGVGPDRLELLAWMPDGQHHLEAYRRVDLALDTWPYNGVTTTCEALWMGVPVISMSGPMAVSRQGLALLQAVGLPQLAAGSADAWLDRAAQLATDLPALQALRTGLRERMAASPLMDSEGFARAFELALRSLWQATCAGPLQE